MTHALSHDGIVTILPTADVGGTTAATAWLGMENFDRIYAFVQIGASWDAADDLDHCRLEQATNASGDNPKELTTDAVGGDYDTANPLDAAGDFAIIEARAEDLDVDGGYTHVRLVVGEDGNTGVDEVSAVLIRYSAAHGKAEQQGAAVAGSKVYVRPS